MAIKIILKSKRSKRAQKYLDNVNKHRQQSKKRQLYWPQDFVKPHDLEEIIAAKIASQTCDIDD